MGFMKLGMVALVSLGIIGSVEAADTFYCNGQKEYTSNGNHYYPNGQMVKAQNGKSWWPNGQLYYSGAHGNGTYFYPNGARMTGNQGQYYMNGNIPTYSGRVHYPNGQGVEISGRCYYPNGTLMGSSGCPARLGYTEYYGSFSVEGTLSFSSNGTSQEGTIIGRRVIHREGNVETIMSTGGSGVQIHRVTCY